MTQTITQLLNKANNCYTIAQAWEKDTLNNACPVGMGTSCAQSMRDMADAASHKAIFILFQ